MRRPPRLEKRGHRFYCRTSVPRDLRPTIGRAEIVRALKTADYAEAKSILSMVRLRLRGLTGARDEFLLTATVQNLKRLADRTARPPPQPMMA